MSSSLMQVLTNLDNHSQELEQTMSKVVNQLAKNGIKLSIDLVGQVRTSNQLIKEVRGQAHESVIYLALLQDMIQKSALVNSSLELDAVLKRIVETIVSLTGAERAYLMLKESSSDELTIRTRYNWVIEDVPDDVGEYSRSVVEAALSEGHPIITTNALEDERFSGAASISDMNLLSILCIPLMSQGKPLGVLYADSNIRQGIFPQNLMSLLSAFAIQATLAIQNARIFERVKEDLEHARREVNELRIQVDHEAIDREMRIITDSAYFQNLESMVEELREEFKDDVL